MQIRLASPLAAFAAAAGIALLAATPKDAGAVPPSSPSQCFSSPVIQLPNVPRETFSGTWPGFQVYPRGQMQIVNDWPPYDKGYCPTPYQPTNYCPPMPRMRGHFRNHFEAGFSIVSYPAYPQMCQPVQQVCEQPVQQVCPPSSVQTTGNNNAVVNGSNNNVTQITGNDNTVTNTITIVQPQAIPQFPDTGRAEFEFPYGSEDGSGDICRVQYAALGMELVKAVGKQSAKAGGPRLWGYVFNHGTGEQAELYTGVRCQDEKGLYLAGRIYFPDEPSMNAHEFVDYLAEALRCGAIHDRNGNKVRIDMKNLIHVSYPTNFSCTN